MNFLNRIQKDDNTNILFASLHSSREGKRYINSFIETEQRQGKDFFISKQFRDWDKNLKDNFNSYEIKLLEDITAGKGRVPNIVFGYDKMPNERYILKINTKEKIEVEVSKLPHEIKEGIVLEESTMSSTAATKPTTKKTSNKTSEKETPTTTKKTTATQDKTVMMTAAIIFALILRSSS